MTIYRLKLKDLNSTYVRKLQEQYQDKEVGVEIRVQESKHSEIPATTMTADLFWKIISLFDWEKEGNDEAVIEPAVQYLSELPDAAILTFYDLLSEKLYLLDGKEYARHSTKDNQGISSDLFLYARCCVVANGRAVYEKVLNAPSTFPKDFFFEILLELPDKAWFRKTAKPLEYLPKYIYETGFNPNGWGDQAITL